MRIAHLSYYYGTKNTSAVVDDMRCLLVPIAPRAALC